MRPSELLGAGTAIVFLVLPMVSTAAAQCDCGYPQPCTIATNIADFTSTPEHTSCTVRTSAGYASVAYTLTTPRGEQYRIENPITIFDGWYINGDAGVRVDTGDAAHPCYRTARIQICIGR